MSGRERRMADQTPVAVEHRDFDLYRLAGNDLCRRCSRGARDRIAERDAVFLRVAECFGRSVGGENALGEGFGTAGALGELGEDCEIDLPTPRMEIEQSLRELRHLAYTTGNGDARDRMSPQIFQHAADEIAHVDQRDLLQVMQLLHRRFGSSAGRAGDMGEACGAGDIDAAMDRVDPGRAGIGNDDPCRAEDREPADDAEAAVQKSLAASASPPGMAISISTSPLSP